MFDGRQAGVIDLSDFDVPVFRHLILVRGIYAFFSSLVDISASHGVRHPG